MTDVPAATMRIASVEAASHEQSRARYPDESGFHSLERYQDFLEFFLRAGLHRAHSTKQREDATAWALDTDAETLVATELAPRFADAATVRALTDRVPCPILVIHGLHDAVRPHDSGAALAELTGWAFVSLRGCGHTSQARATP